MRPTPPAKPCPPISARRNNPVEYMSRVIWIASSLATPVIVKYRDEKTDSAVQLEDFLR